MVHRLYVRIKKKKKKKCRSHRADAEIFVQGRNPRNILALLEINFLALQHNDKRLERYTI